ncbi:MAG: hypothetical protein BWX90_00448 [bacterium ADurb.Bin132]|nr:MAG: hypothetical protein BWX90_00448 [bacterium ADurb.Bin132]
MRFAALADETIGTSFVFNDPIKYDGKLSGRPAPEKITSIPSWIAVFTISAKFERATMTLIPNTPFVISLARLISRLKALMLASRKFVLKSGSNMPIPAVAITPTPPWLATALARPEREIPTPIPPWIMGILMFRLPIENFFGILIFCAPFYILSFVK